MRNNKLGVIFMALTAALAGVLFGYDAGIISGVLLFVKDIFQLSDVMQGLVVSAVPFGALVFALLCGKFNDIFGRKAALLCTACLFGFGALLCAFAESETALLIGRLLLGFAIGIGSFSAPLYIAEISDEKSRGALVTINQLAIVSGILISYIISFILTPFGAWRWMLGLSFIPAAILFFSALKLPASPRWLMTKQRFEEAKKVLELIHGPEKAKEEMAQLKIIIAQKQLSLREIFRGNYLKVILLGIFVSILTQAVGINAIIYYAPTIFEATGFSQATGATLATVGIGLINFIFTIVAIYLLDKVGRRKLLLTGTFGIVLSLIVLTIGFSKGISNSSFDYIILGSMLFFIACQAIGTGPACWLIPSEIFPLKIRGAGMGLAVAFNWGANVVVAFLFPIVLDHFGAAISFGIFLIIAIIAYSYFYLRVPETKNVSLEQIEANLSHNRSMRELGNAV